jgi:molybdate transport system substrate-binding protein
MRKVAIAFPIAVALLLQGPIAQAAEIKVLSGGILRFALNDIAKGFERLTGEKLVITYGPVGVMKAKFLNGAPADVVILPQPDMVALVRAHRIGPGSVEAVARTDLALAVRKGLPKPDIGSVAALKRTLLTAKSIAYFDPKGGWEQGVEFRRVIARLGIAKRVAARAKLLKSPQESAAEKDADIVINYAPPLLRSANYEMVGLLPSPVQNPARSTWAAGAAVKAADPAAADVVRVLASPESAAAFRAQGFQLPK